MNNMKYIDMMYLMQCGVIQNTKQESLFIIILES